MEESLYISDQLTIPGSELWSTASLSGGPGGQHVNKVCSRVALHWNVNTSAVLSDEMRYQIATALKNRMSGDGVLAVVVDSHRSQHRNRQTARRRFAELIAQSLQVPKKRVATRVSLGARRRRVDEKRSRSRTKQMRRRPSSHDF